MLKRRHIVDLGRHLERGDVVALGLTDRWSHASVPEFIEAILRGLHVGEVAQNIEARTKKGREGNA